MDIASHTLSDLHVEHFRGLQGLRLDACGAVNIVVGGNNSGKTSVLEAVSLLANPISPVQWEAAVDLRRTWPLLDLRFRGGSVDRLDGISWLFPRHQGAPAPISIHGKLGRFGTGFVASASRILGEPPPQAILTPDEYVEGALLWRGTTPERQTGPSVGLAIEILMEGLAQARLFGELVDRHRLVLWERGRSGALRVRQDREGGVRVAFSTPIAHRSDGYLAGRIGRLLRSRRKEGLLALMRGLDPKITDILMVSPEDPGEESAGLRRDSFATLHVEHGDAGLVPVHVMGDGTRRALHLAALVADIGSGGILLIDEVEVGMHPSALREVFRWLVEACGVTGVQLFVTTHSIEAVDAMMLSTPPGDLTLFRLRGGTVRRYSGDLLRTARMDLGQEVR